MGLIFMDWDVKSVARLESMIGERWSRFSVEHRTDRKNRSELWNIHVGKLGITCWRPKNRKGATGSLNHQDAVDIINFRNHEVADAICVRNPDRIGQYLFVPRKTASKILMLGMP